MTQTSTKTCIYPGCDRPAVPPHPMGGPQPSFCEIEEHNALTAHQERRRLTNESSPGVPPGEREPSDDQRPTT